MFEFATTRSIAATPERTWRVLADVVRWPEWTPSVLRVELLGSEPLGVGIGVRIHQPKLRPAVWTISEWVPERRFTWVARGPGVRIVAEHSLQPDPRGCVVEHRVRFEGILRGIAGRIYGKLVSHYLNQEADGLRSRSEQVSTFAPESHSP